MHRKLPQLPSIVWVIIFVGGIVLFIGSIITFFVMIATVPGFASLIFLALGLIYIFSPSYSSSPKIDTIARAIGVGFFALMGMAIDQPGNFIYNYPFQFFCPPETTLNRTVDVSHPLPGRTDMVQDFRCVDSDGKFVKRINVGTMIGVRFVEYLILAYVLIGLKTMKNRVSEVTRRVTAQESHSPASSE